MPKTISFSAKCSDMFSARLTGEDGNVIGRYDGYVPNFFGEDEDYVELTVDIESGKILDWKRPTQKDLTIFKVES